MISKKDILPELISQLAISFREEDTDACRRKWARHIIDNKISLIGLSPLLDYERHIALRFAWLIGGVCEMDPKFVFPFIKYFFAKRKELEILDFNRSLAKMFYLSGIPEEIEGEAIDEMFQWILDSKVNVSTKCYATDAIYKMTGRYPELKNELKSVIEDQLTKNSAAFEKRSLKVLEKLAGGPDKVKS